MQFKSSVDINPIIDFLTEQEKTHLPYVMARTLTGVAKVAQEDERREMSRVFDRPTPFTLNSTFIKSADYRKIRSGAGDYAEVRIKDRDNSSSNLPINWLSPEIYGGARNVKAFENWLVRYGRMPSGYVLVPGEAMTLDRYGNVPRGELNKIAADLKAQLDIYSNTTPNSARRRRASRTKRPQFYFSTYLGGYVAPTVRHLKPGIYQRTEFASGSAIRPAFLFVRFATYRTRFNFHEIAKRAGDANMQRIFNQEMQNAINSYKAKQPKP